MATRWVFREPCRSEPKPARVTRPCISQLPRGSRLTFYSDGIVEAMNSKGELLGFDRSRLLSMEPVSKIVEEAQKFGQHDDITVIAITREAALAREASLAQTVPIAAPALAN